MSPALRTTLAARTDELALTCPLSPWVGDPDTCRQCGGWLGWRSPTNTLFCGKPCAHTFWANHSWPKAKEEARKRAGRRCERCGAKAGATHGVHHRDGDKEGGRPRTASCDHHQEAGPDGRGGLIYLCRGCHNREHHGARGAA